MVNDAVPDERFVNRSLLGIANRECAIGAVPIGTRGKFPLEGKYVLLQPPFELLHVFARPFAPAELHPSQKQILWRDDPFEDMLVYFHGRT